MKRTILVFGLAAGFAAAGQQKDMVDISGLVKQRIDAKMKQKTVDGLLLKQLPQVNLLNSDFKGVLHYQLSNGDLAFRLPVDHMPCVKPGNLQVYNMPVIRNNKVLIQPGETAAIPNPGL
jgi:hypothetical protein